MSEHAYPDLLEHVAEDSELSPAEKETTFRFDKTGETVTGYSAEAGLVRRALAHPHIEVADLTVRDEDARRDVHPDEYGGEAPITGVRLKAPIGLFTIKSTPRQSTGHADLITDRVLSEVNA